MPRASANVPAAATMSSQRIAVPRRASAPRSSSSVQARSSPPAMRAPVRSAPVRSQPSKRTQTRSASWKSAWRRLQPSKTPCSSWGAAKAARSMRQSRRTTWRRAPSLHSRPVMRHPRTATRRIWAPRASALARLTPSSSASRSAMLIRRAPPRSAPAMRTPVHEAPGSIRAGSRSASGGSSGRSGGSGAIGRRGRAIPWLIGPPLAVRSAGDASAAHRPDRRGSPPLGGALGRRALARDGGRHLAHARPAGAHGAPERPAAPVRTDLPALRGADAALVHPRGRAAAGQDRRAPAGPPHLGDQHHRQARGRRTRAARAPRGGPARDAGRDHRRGPRCRQGGHRGAQRRMLRHRLAPAARSRAPHRHPSCTEARRGRLHPVASGPPQIRGLPTISSPMAASTPTVPTTEAQWRAAYALGHERDVPFSTLRGLPIKPLYTEADLPDAAEIGLPGGYPFTRGVYPSMYRGRLWTMSQFAGFGTAEETNERFRYLLEHGQTGLSTAFDMPSLMGHDSDHARSLGEVGREGVAIDTLDDMQTLFAGIPLGDVSVSMTINAPAAIMLAFYVVAAEAQGVPADRLSGTIQADILKEYIAQKEWCFPIDPAMRLLGDMIEWASGHMPRWHPVSISGYHIREAGSTAAQELAFTLKDGLTYVEQAVERGLDVDDFAPRLSFFFNAQIDFFEEIAKYRAARRIWAHELKHTYGAKNERSLLMRFHTQTPGVSLTAQQPLNNISRTTVEALAGVLGGTQSLHTNSYDEALALPTEEAVRLALRTQQVIAHETGVTNTVDPLGGSYFVEALTDQMEARAYEYFAKIDELGGMVEAVKRHFPQREIAEAAFAPQQEVDAGQRVVVGVNRYMLGDEPPLEILRIAPDLERKQVGRVQAVRAGRDTTAMESALTALR